MATFLFDKVVFGPVKSRRLGVSLGINLLPITYKYCTFDCVYCECGWSYADKINSKDIPSRVIVKQALENKLIEIKEGNGKIEAITFAGNGEPTIHPDFAEIIDDTIELRNLYFPKVSITVFSNATTINKESIFNALNKVDNNVLKLDVGSDDTLVDINRPKGNYVLSTIINDLKKYNGDLVLQTLFVRGEYNGKYIDNTKKEELELWMKHVIAINPKYIMIYPYSRSTAAENLEIVSISELNDIADKLRSHGVDVEVY